MEKLRPEEAKETWQLNVIWYRGLDLKQKRDISGKLVRSGNSGGGGG